MFSVRNLNRMSMKSKNIRSLSQKITKTEENIDGWVSVLGLTLGLGLTFSFMGFCSPKQGIMWGLGWPVLFPTIAVIEGIKYTKKLYHD